MSGETSETGRSLEARSSDDPHAPFLSIIIPVLDEAGSIGPLVRRLRDTPDCEIVVVDGGSGDCSAAEARAAGADGVLVSPRGRAVQQNTGAAHARGDALLFLHADCDPAAGFVEAIREALGDLRCVGGCFRQRIDAAGAAYRLLEWGNALRVRALKWAYGDQGIFVRREVFERLGGFPELALMEDLYFMKRLKRSGRIALLDARLRVSPRRWQRRGVLRQTLRNWALIALAHCGVSPDRLARFYAAVR
ncbi:MAG: TIGR04283 family arsenosugar biosynthesis glycosyltransferase [Planctomycetales bacterium]